MNPIRKAAVAAALVGSTVAGGAIGAAFVNGSAVADTSTTTAPAATAPAPAPTQAPPQGQGQGQGQGPGHPAGPHQANGITETILTGDTATKVTAAAQAAVPGGTIQRVETDAEGAVYEAHMLKADGTPVTVKFDANYNVTATETGGPGGGGPHGGKPAPTS